MKGEKSRSRLCYVTHSGSDSRVDFAARQTRKAIFYQELSPNLHSIRAQHRHSRFNIVLDYLTESRILNSGTILDIGAFFSYFCTVLKR